MTNVHFRNVFYPRIENGVEVNGINDVSVFAIIFVISVHILVANVSNTDFCFISNHLYRFYLTKKTMNLYIENFY